MATSPTAAARDSTAILVGYYTRRVGAPGPISFRCRRRLLTPIRRRKAKEHCKSASGDASYNSHFQRLIGPGGGPVSIDSKDRVV